RGQDWLFPARCIPFLRGFPMPRRAQAAFGRHARCKPRRLPDS
ncbi:hypothetical protein BN1723_019199, partial [Verticillium longisporum]